jgi:hypothetical protein
MTHQAHKHCHHTGCLKHKCLLNDSSAIHTPTINTLDTYKINAFCMTHQVYRQGLTTYLVLTKQMLSVWLNRDRHLMLTCLVPTKQWSSVWQNKHNTSNEHDSKPPLKFTKQYSKLYSSNNRNSAHFMSDCVTHNKAQLQELTQRWESTTMISE